MRSPADLPPHVRRVLKAAEEVLTKIRHEADGGTSTQPLEMDIWVHLGRQLLSNVNYGKTSCHFYREFVRRCFCT